MATANSRMPTGRTGDAADSREAGADTLSGGSDRTLAAGVMAAEGAGQSTGQDAEPKPTRVHPRSLLRGAMRRSILRRREDRPLGQAGGRAAFRGRAEAGCAAWEVCAGIRDKRF